MEPLVAQVRQSGPLEPADAVGWAIRLAKRVEELHRLGVAHGGLSAEAIQTEGRARTSRGLLADVRNSREAVPYQSPERLAGGGISQADDTWAIAVALYVLLTGTLPFPGDQPAAVRQRIAAGPPVPLSNFGLGATGLQPIMDGFLAPQVGQRTSRVASLRDALERWGGAPDLGQLFPLEEEDTDGYGTQNGDDDEDEDEDD
ncbi:MAG: hypothetical protein JRI23_34050, partial [Deltaproteobacteria bacterium]|nr:hypothetical protein [Deltaproteobacteria bacterium]MBW2537316.1 hypothetical protein [Deltaproteobacteria bacterium]